MTQPSRINVRLERYSDFLGTGIQLRVSLQSRIKSRVHTRSSQIVYKNEPFEKLRKLAEAAGGACAEYQNEQYGDRHDPSEVARVVVETFDKIVEGLNKGIMVDGNTIH